MPQYYWWIFAYELEIAQIVFLRKGGVTVRLSAHLSFIGSRRYVTNDVDLFSIFECPIAFTIFHVELDCAFCVSHSASTTPKMIRMKQKIRPKKWNEKKRSNGIQIYGFFSLWPLIQGIRLFFLLHFRLLSVFTEYLRILCKRPYPPCNQFYLIWYSFYISFPTTASHPFPHTLPFDITAVFGVRIQFSKAFT